MTQESPDLLNRLAYQEAGHAVMFFLIERGYMEDHLPFSRVNILPEFTLLTIKAQRMNWGETTYSLGSLITVPQVLLAGYLAERIKSQLQDNQFSSDSPLVKLALHLITCYVQEYGGDEMSIADSHEIAAEQFKEIADHVNASLHKYWPSVEALGVALLQHATLAKANVYQLIEESIPLEEQEKAQHFLATYNADDAIMKWLEEGK